jgi:hypothetical protein
MNEIPQVLQRLIDLGRSLEPVTVAVCHPCSDISLCGAVEAAQAQLIAPVLVGPPALASDSRACEAIDLFVYRAARKIGSLAAAAGGVDALAFTAGIGEHAPEIRDRICEQSAWFDDAMKLRTRSTHC